MPLILFEHFPEDSTNKFSITLIPRSSLGSEKDARNIIPMQVYIRYGRVLRD